MNKEGEIIGETAKDNLERVSNLFSMINEYSDRVPQMDRKGQMATILVKKFDLTSNGFEASLCPSLGSGNNQCISLSFKDDIVWVSPERNSLPNMDVGHLDNAMQYSFFSVCNPVNGYGFKEGKPWARKIVDESTGESLSMFYRDDKDILHFRADLSPIGLGLTFAKEDPTTLAWIFTNAEGHPLEFDIKGNVLEWPSLMTYMKINRHKEDWIVKKITIGEKPGVDYIQLLVSNSYINDHFVDVHYNHNAGLYRIGNQGDYSRFTLSAGLNTIGSRNK